MPPATGTVGTMDLTTATTSDDDLDDDLDDACSECGAPLDDGEGYDGRCGTCADIHESTCSICGGRFVEDSSTGALVHDPDAEPPPGWVAAGPRDLDADHVPVGPYD